MNMKRLTGLLAFAMALGMFLMLLIHSEIIGLIIIALLLVIGYYCYCCK